LPYDKWGIKKLAKKAGLIMVRKVDFCKDDYPGYNQKKGDGVTSDESFPLGPCCTFMFCARDEEKLKQVHRNSVGLTSSCCGDSKFYPGISATDMMWPFDLHPAWPQPHFPPVHMPIAFDPCPFGVAEMEDPFNCYGTSFHHQEMVQPTYQEQPWYQDGPPIEPPWTTPRTPESANGVRNSQATDAVPEYPYMEYVERQAMFGNVDSSIWQTVN
jgi:25S rRNA (uracil2634-N3)-methyltransferase